MKHLLLTAMIMVLGCITNMPLSCAQTSAVPQPIDAGIRLIDLGYIFINHKQFNQIREKLKKDVIAREAELQAKQKEIQQIIGSMKNLQPGSFDYSTREEQVTKLKADLQVQVTIDRKNAMKTEAQIYFNTYNEILRLVKLIATQNGVTLVLQFNGETLDRTNPDTRKMMSSLSKPVIYHYSGIDITPIILNSLNANNNPATASGIVGPPR